MKKINKNEFLVTEKSVKINEDVILEKGDRIKVLNEFNNQLNSAETIGQNHAINAKKIYDWANKFKINLTLSGYYLVTPEANLGLLDSILNDKLSKKLDMKKLSFIK